MVLSDQQLKYNDCGISAIKSIFNFYNIDIDRDYIAEKIVLDDKGAWLQDIKLFFESHAFNTSFNLLDVNTIRPAIDKVKPLLPCILPVKSNRGLHYVVLCNIEQNKFIVLDPANPGVLKWTVNELVQHAAVNPVMYNWADSRQVLLQMIHAELAVYGVSYSDLPEQQETVIANKLTYFSYLKNNFGFAGESNEKAFLVDLLYNHKIDVLPVAFRTMHLEESKLKINTPVILSVKKKEETVNMPVAVTQKKERLYGKLFKELKEYKKIWYIFLFTALFGATTAQLTIFSNQFLIDNILPSYSTNTILVFAAGFGIFKLFELIINTYKTFISIQLATIFDHHFLTSFVKKLNHFPIRYIQSFSRGDLSERMKDSLTLKTFFLTFFTRVLVDSIVSVFSLIFLLMIDWQVTLIIIAIMFIFVIWFRIITPRIQENENRRFLQKSGLFSSVLENIDGMQVIKLFGLEYYFQQRARPAIDGMVNIQKKVRYINLVNTTVINFIIVAATILIIILLSLKSTSTHSVTTGQIISFLALSGRIFSALINILEENLALQENAIVLKRYFDFKAPVKKDDGDYARLTSVSINEVRFEHIYFEYIPDKPVLKDFSLGIRAGQKIKLEGGNGAGKSTFCKVLAMMYEPSAGNIFINNERIVLYNRSLLRKKILLISNDDALFNDTLGFNIFFDKEIDVAKALELARLVGFHEFIAEKDEGLDFIITEQGKNLSTGQRKKILLMRALVSDAELIIVDEVFAGIDVASKTKIEQYINGVTDKAFIIISHEPVNEIIFHRILTLEDGHVL